MNEQIIDIDNISLLSNIVLGNVRTHV